MNTCAWAYLTQPKVDQNTSVEKIVQSSRQYRDTLLVHKINAHARTFGTAEPGSSPIQPIQTLRSPWSVQHEQAKNMADRWIDPTEAETEDSDATTCEDLSFGWVHELVYDYLVHKQSSSLEPPRSLQHSEVSKCNEPMADFLWLHQPAVNNLVGGGGGGVVSRARRTFRRLRGKSTSGHPLIPFWCKCAGMLAHCSFPIKRVTSRTIIFRFRQRASSSATSRLPTWMLTERFKLLVLN